MAARIDYVIGGSGTGKTTHLLERFVDEAVKSPDKRFLMIVPEQAAGNTERDMVKTMSLRHGRNGFMNIDIIGISRLAYKIFNELESSVGGMLSDAGKSMLIRLVAGRTDLRVYKNSIDKDGFIAETKSLLSELFQYNITLTDIEKVIDELEKTGENPVLSGKLRDMASIYKGFEERMAEKEDGVITAERLVAYLLNQLQDKSCRALDGAVIAFDSFTGFTPSQYSLILELMKRAERITFSITMDASIIKSGREVKEYEVFNLSYVTYKRLEELKEKLCAGQESGMLLLEENRRHREDSMLKALEAGMFRFPVRPFTKAGDSDKTTGNSVRLWKCKNPEEQLRCIAEEIRRKVSEEGYRYNEIAVLAPDLSEMTGSFEKIFKMYDIPFFADYTVKLMQSPFTEAVISLLEAEEKNYDYDSMFSLLKTGVLKCVSDDDVMTLENFVLKKNIRGVKRWNRCFSYTLNNEIYYENEENIRKRLMEGLGEIHRAFTEGGRTVSDYAAAIRLFMQQNSFKEQTEAAAEKLEGSDMKLSRTYRSLYSRIDEFLEKMVAVLGEEKLSMREFSEIFKTGINEIRLGTLPASLDSVVVGDIERTRLSDVRLIFLIDVNEGIIPKPGKPAKILNDYEKDCIEELFKRLDIRKELAPNDKKELYIEQLYIYLCLSKAREQLVICTCNVSRSGEELEASYIISRIRGILPGIVEEKAAPTGAFGTISSDVYSFTGMMREQLYEKKEEENDDDLKELAVLYSLYRDKKALADEAAGYSDVEDKLSDDATLAAQKGLFVQSVSKLEEYAGCEYKYFLNYMLRLRERDSYQLDQMQFGNVMHGALEKVFRKMDEKDPKDTYLNWVQADDAALSAKMKEAIDTEFRAMSDELLSPEGEIIAEGRNRYIMKNIYELGDRTIKNLGMQIRGGEMSPRFYENKFNQRDDFASTSIAVPGVTGNVKLEGKIDRVDILDKGDTIYLRVIDYKTGNKDFSYSDLFYGKQLQLTVYLSVMVEKVKKIYKNLGRDVKVVPVGMYYNPVKDPYVEKPDSLDEEAIEKAIRRELRLKGLTGEEPEYQEMQEKGITDPERRLEGPADILGMDFYSKAYKGNPPGSPKGTHVLVNEDDFENIESFAGVKIKELAGDMLKGSIRRNPFTDGRNKTCDFCKYNDICRFDQVNRGDRAVYIKSDDEKAFQTISNIGGAAKNSGKVE